MATQCMQVRGFGAFGAAEGLPATLTPADLVARMRPVDVAYTAVQLANAEIIAREFTAAGYGTSVVIAALVNAMAESRLGRSVQSQTGDGGHSIGLFQLNDRGAGKGMSVAERMDPVINTRTIIDVESGYLKSKVVPCDRASDATYQFCYFVERPKDKLGDAAARKAMSRVMFPDMADIPKATLPKVVMQREELAPLVAGQRKQWAKRLARSPVFWVSVAGGVFVLSTVVYGVRVNRAFQGMRL